MWNVTTKKEWYKQELELFSIRLYMQEESWTVK